MRVWHYRAEDRVYNGLTSLADPSPLEPGVFLIPAHATEIEPPKVIPEGQQAHFDGYGKWVLEFIPLPPKPPLREILKAVPVRGFGGKTIFEVLRGEP
jgi:hypothetical protein